MMVVEVHHNGNSCNEHAVRSDNVQQSLFSWADDPAEGEA